MAKQALLQRWKNTTVANQALVLTGTLVALSSLFYTGAAIVQVYIINESARQQGEQANRLIAASERMANTAQTQANTSASQAESLREQSNTMGKTLIETQKSVNASEKQANASQALARAAQQSADAAAQAFAIGERAYVGIKDIKLLTPLEEGQHPSIRMILTNSGRTPAWGLTTYLRVIVTNEPVDLIFAKYPVDAAASVRTNQGFLPAGTERAVVFSTDLIITSEDLTMIKAKTGKLLVAFEARYKDSQGRLQTLSARAIYNPTDDGFYEQH